MRELGAEVFQYGFKVVFKDNMIALCDNKFNVIKLYNLKGEENEVTYEKNKR